MGRIAGKSKPRIPWDRDQAIEQIFEALELHGVDALVRLRDGRDDPRTLARWAHAHFLTSPGTIVYIRGVVARWRKRPDLAAALSTRWRMSLTGTYDPIKPEARVLQSTASRLLADTPTLREWRDTAEKLYQEFQQIQGRRRPVPQPDPATWTQYAQWFVLHQVQGFTPAVIAGMYETEETTVNKGLAAIARVTSIHRRSNRSGIRRGTLSA